MKSCVCLIIALVALCSHFVYRDYCHKQSAEKLYLRRETAVRLIDKQKFSEKLRQTPPAWMSEQIAEDFSEFIHTGISKKQVDETFQAIRKNYPHPMFIRYRIIDNRLYRYFPDNERISLADNPTEKALKTLLYFFKFNDLDFILSHADGVPLPEMPNGFYFAEKRELQAPILISAKIKETPYAILIPDWRSVSKWWASDIQSILHSVDSKPWSGKRESAFWRGSLTKPIRLTFCQLAARYPHYLDAKLNVKVDDPVFQEKIENEGLFGERVPMDHFLDYKYLPILDGVCCAAPAYQWRLLSNSLTLKQESDEIQWFYRALKPWSHYLPIKNDLSDFLEKVEWAKSHDRECREIVKNASDFARNHLMMEDVYLYFYLVMKQYASIQKINKKEIEKETKKDPRWVNIQRRSKLIKRAYKEQSGSYVCQPTPY